MKEQCFPSHEQAQLDVSTACKQAKGAFWLPYMQVRYPFQHSTQLAAESSLRARHVKCDEEKPVCARCLLGGRTCAYGTPEASSVMLPRTLAPSPEVDPTTAKALELFFLRTAPQLAGNFQQTFFQGSVLQLSLGEPTIRQAIAALGSLHEHATADKIPPSRRNSLITGPPIKLYNKAIRSLIEMLTTDPHNFQVVAIANILFICFEYFQGNVEAAASHIRSGIKIFNSWREASRKELSRPWGQQYDSLEANFMETEIGPLLSLFNMNAFQWNLDTCTTLLLNPVDDEGNIILPEKFELVEEARAALLDLITSATLHFQQFDLLSKQGGSSATQFSIIQDLVAYDRAQWNFKFDEWVRRKERTWDESEQRAADAVSIMSFGFDCQIGSYQPECYTFDWNTNRSAYDSAVMTRLSNLSADASRYTDDLSKAFSLDFGMAFPLHAVAWGSRSSHIDRRGLDLRTRIAEPGLLETTKPYKTISSRMNELEELYLDWTPPDSSRGESPAPEACSHL
ncbi:hypothetical protein N7481_001591 [Penicillium waksmanii]|uniref:uncharacterized protein n=1 Tax=Penicillium waksmanii TaxID=69791 RepID=UPI002546BFCB|nr:uncharacterized protein N7481_001591 [Penicillium waksmanii]KAJ6001182.1 hypothetical protein N7481_001591 [Penicillium waksmanii]